jgi:hypothetical protein
MDERMAMAFRFNADSDMVDWEIVSGEARGSIGREDAVQLADMCFLAGQPALGEKLLRVIPPHWKNLDG